MGQKEKIMSLLQTNEAMTQGQLAENIYGDKVHVSNIYYPLMELVKNGIIIRTETNPAKYYLRGKPTPITPNQNKYSKKKHRDVSNDIISNESLDKISLLVESTNNYGPENKLISRCLHKFPYNNDPDVVAMKIGLIDITNSTHLSQHKSLISMDELCHIIASIPEIDNRIKVGDPEVVNEIARSNGNINLFSFATKYCCYHNRNLYGNDDYSILDTVLKEYLPIYFNDITKNQIQKWQSGFEYKKYNDYITKKLDELRITTTNRKRKFDHFIWYKNR